MTARALLTASAVLLLDTSALPGQSCGTGLLGGTCVATTTVRLVAGTVIEATQPTSATALGSPTTADFEVGFRATTGPTITVRANQSWQLQVRAATSVWGAGNTSPGVAARTDKPASDLRWSTVAGGPFIALTTSGSAVASGEATAGTALPFFYRALYTWGLDTPGTYTLGVVFTLSSP